MVIGCCHFGKKACPPPPPTVANYHAPGFDWSSVRRVLVLPVGNESDYTRAGDEFANAFSTELQALGVFEVVSPPIGSDPRLAEVVHRSGRFNEALMLELGRCHRADIVIASVVTQYSPYPKPRLGLVVQAVSPRDGLVAASVDGLWDTTRLPDQVRAKLYYRQLPQRHPWIADHKIAPDDGYADELALDSPRLFQRFVCHEAVGMLTEEVASLQSSVGSGPPANGTVPCAATCK
jgi:hypothetical protein